MWQYLEKSGIVTDRPAVLHQIVPCPTAGVTTYDFAVYNGKNTGGDVIVLLQHRYAMPDLTFHNGLECSEGLYVTVGSNLNGVLIVWDHVEVEPTEWERAVAE